MALLRVTHGSNDRIHTEDGRWYIDLVSSTGAVFLGHANEAVNRHVADQLDRISCSWTSALAIQEQCKEVVGRHLDEGYALFSLFSTGMEAAEVALRMAYHHTQRTEVVGFRHNHHGKSLATQNLTGPDPDLPELPGFHRIPFLPNTSESEVLEHVTGALATERVAAVFVEPVQGRGGGHAASREFFHELQRSCRQTGTLLVCDEIFSGFYRTGPCFRYQALGIEPDIVLVGKAISNGFPAAGVVVHHRIRFHPRDFRFGSTFSDNPLACAAVVGTVSEMERIDVQAAVTRIEAVLATIDPGPTATVRLRGAACFVDLGSQERAALVHDRLFAEGVLALRRETIVGYWPPATITDEHLHHVVRASNDALAAAG